MRLPTLKHFGACPVCHETNGYVNIGRDHWFVCDVHKLAWCVGANLFSSWRDETEADWERNRTKLETYAATKPADWGWGEFSCDQLKAWGREWVRGYWWQVAGYRLFRRRMRKLHSQEHAADEFPF